jgi:hypothetical protein
MADLGTKLQLKDAPIRVLHAPDGLDIGVPVQDDAEAVLVFVRSQAELDVRGEPAVAAAREDHLAWIAYPKGGQLGTDLNRDTLWAALEGRGIRPVRQISVDEVWSAMRFRPG